MNEYLEERKLWWPVSPELMAGYRVGSHTKEWGDGTLRWFKNDQLHRDGDNPAYIGSNGTLMWFQNGAPHRDGDKPAQIYPNGTLLWYKNGLLHRDGDNPACIGEDGSLHWYKNEKRHQVTGPAVINQNNEYQYWINGIDITKEVKSWLATRQYEYPFTPEQQVEFTLTFS
jgi:hypothetical protein